MTTTKPPTKERTYISDVTLSIGMLSCIGNLYTLKVPNAGKEDELKLVCPECAASGVPQGFPSQKYMCNDDPTHMPFSIGEARRGKDVQGKIVVLTDAQVEEAKRSVLPEKELDLQVHLRADVEACTFEEGAAYVFKPEGRSKFYGVLVDLLKKRRDVCLVAKTNMRKKDHFVMVDIGLNDNLVIRDMIWPQDMKEFKTEDYDYPAALLAQAEVLIEASVEPFDPQEYRRDSTDRISAAVQEAAGQKQAGKRKKTMPAAASVGEDEVLAKILQQAIDAKKKGKKAS